MFLMGVFREGIELLDRTYSRVLEERRLNAVIDGLGGRTVFTYSAYLSVEILVSSTDNRDATEPARK